MHKLLLTLLSVWLLAAYTDQASSSNLHLVAEKDLSVPQALRQETITIQREMRQQGYHETDSHYAQFLLSLPHQALNEMRAWRGTQNAYDTHLRQRYADIKLAFQFNGIPIDPSHIIGYAPIGSYVHTPQEGWNGIKVFFTTESQLGTCAYEFTDLSLSHGAVTLAKEYTQYFVNHKPTFTSVEGSHGSGFVYTVTWYNAIKVSTLDCASKKYDKTVMAKILTLANQIDRAVISYNKNI